MEQNHSNEQRLQNLEERVALIEDRLTDVINHLNANPLVRPTPRASEKPSTPSTPARSEVNEVHSVSRLLPLVAVICFVLAGVFIVRLAIDSGWLTAERQWFLLCFLGLGLTGFGRWFDRIDSDYRAYLSASGSVVLYIAAFSSAAYFQVVSDVVALGLAIGVSAISLSLFHYHRSELFAVLTAVGTYISPLLLGELRTDLTFNAGFFLLWAIVFSSASTHLKTRTLSLTSAYFGIGVFTLLHARESDPAAILVIIAVLIAQFLAFASGVYTYSLKNNSPLSRQLAFAYLPVLLFFYGTTYYFLNRYSETLAPWIALGFALVVFLLFQNAKKQLQRVESQEMVHVFLTTVLFHAGYLQILPDASKPWLLPALLLAGHVAQSRENLPKISAIFRVALGVIGFIEFARICFDLISKPTLLTVLPATATIFLGFFYYLRAHRWVQNQQLIFLSGIHLLSILSLYRIAYAWGSLAVSLAWGLYAALVLTYAYKKKDGSLANSALVVLIVASLKALIYDATQAPSGVRILSLLVTGGVLYLAGFAFKRVQSWR